MSEEKVITEFEDISSNSNKPEDVTKDVAGKAKQVAKKAKKVAKKAEKGAEKVKKTIDA